MEAGIIALAEPYACGNAIHLVLDAGSVPPGGQWRLLRKATNDFSGQDDPGAILIATGGADSVMQSIADQPLANGAVAYYCSYVFDGTDWNQGEIFSATPGYALSDQSVDVYSLIRDRLRQGLAAEVAAGKIFANAESGRIEVLNQPPQWENVKWPVVTVHLEQDASDERALGEELAAPEADGEDWQETQGWISRWRLQITTWSLNPDERIALRNAAKRIVIGNLAVLRDTGILMPELTFADTDHMNEFPAPVYCATGTFTCAAVSATAGEEDSIEEIDITVNGDDYAKAQ